MAKGNFSAGIFGAALGVAAGAAFGAYLLGPAAGVVEAPAVGDSGTAVEQAADAQAQADATDQILTAAEPDLINGKLEDVPVMIIATADAEADDVDALGASLTAAGAQDAGRLTLTGQFTGVEGADRLGDLVAGVVPEGVTLDEARMTPGRHAGQALAPALLLGEDGEPAADGEARTLVLNTLRDNGYLQWDEGTLRPARAIVVVDGPERDTFADGVVADFTAALGQAPGAVALAAPATGDGSALDALDSAPGADTVAKVPAVAGAAGRVGVVQALAGQIADEPPVQTNEAPEEPAVSAESESAPERTGDASANTVTPN